MSAVVVDTNVVSYQFKRDSRALLFDPYLRGKTWFLSFMTTAELERWALARRWGERLTAQLDRHLKRFAVIYADRNLCRWWAETTHRANRAGKPIDPADAWIAATALALDAPLVTNDPHDYAGVTGLRVLVS
ncbi:MAG: PIN domain-containing protein [Planctomycetes bacterium]|nr:PIN domain-containing protein [Planctomycetota bacterium]